jgi:hypothetical protein
MQQNGRGDRTLERCNKIRASFLQPRSALRRLEFPEAAIQAQSTHPKGFWFFFSKKNKIEAGVSRKKQRLFIT